MKVKNDEYELNFNPKINNLPKVTFNTDYENISITKNPQEKKKIRTDSILLK